MKRIIDLRSDTVTKPSDEMKQATLAAELGDDVYGEDPTVKELEKLSANMFGKEAAVFVPSGTMANLASVMSHCWNRGEEILLGDQSHIHKFEQGGISQLAGIYHSTLTNIDDGTFSLTELQSKIRKENIHCPRSKLVCIENTHNWCYGSVIEPDFVDKLEQIAKSNNLKVHCDGARIFNASVYLKTPVSRLTEKCDSVAFCLSKGLCCPLGSVVVGEKEFAERVRRMRKVLGGGMRQVGYVAATGIVALNTMIDRLEDDHRHAAMIAKAFEGCENGAIKVDLNRVKTNIVFVDTDPEVITSDQM
ncbi:putative low-specificity L-threonine aldolase 2-like protein, partial [Dinothrombium tinctorium]